MSSISSIKDYVNDLITSNRDQEPAQIEMYFTIMQQEAQTLLQQLNDARRLVGMENIVANQIINLDQAKVIREAVDYILQQSNNLEMDLDLLQKSGLLNLTDVKISDVYKFSYQIEPVLKRASELVHDNFNWWKSLWLRNKPADHFCKQYETATLNKSEDQLEVMKIDVKN